MLSKLSPTVGVALGLSGWPSGPLRVEDTCLEKKCSVVAADALLATSRASVAAHAKLTATVRMRERRDLLIALTQARAVRLTDAHSPSTSASRSVDDARNRSVVNRR